MSNADRVQMSFSKERIFGQVADGIQAQGTLTLDTNPANTDAMTLDAKTYTFQTVLTDVDGNIQIGATLSETQDNIRDAINLTGTPGTQYAASMTLHPTISADAANGFIGNDLVLTAKTPGTAGNALVSTETFTAGTNVFDAATLGTTQAGVEADYQILRMTGETLQLNPDTVTSNEIRNDRVTEDIIRTNLSAAGDLNLEMSFGAYDVLMETAFQSAPFTSDVSDTQSTFSMDASDNSINDSGSGFIAAGFLVNQWFRSSGFLGGNAANNAIFKIVSVAAGKMVLNSGTLGVVVTEAAGDTVTIKQGGQILNGTTQLSFTFEKEFTDLIEVFTQVTGLTTDGFNLTIAAGEIITGAFNFLGKNENSAKVTAAASKIAAPTNDIMNAVDNIAAILENKISIQVFQTSFAIVNALRQRPAVGVLGPISLGAGQIGISGTVQVYFEDQDLMDKYRNFTETSLAIVATDNSGNSYIFEFPAIKLTIGNANATGLNTDVIAEMTFGGKLNSSEGIMMRIARIAA